jgi:hypothetical protein
VTAAPVSAADDRLIPRHHRTAGVPAALPLSARDLIPDAERAGQVEPLGAGWLTVTVVIGVMAALIALGGMVLSFRAVSTEMIPAFGARWAWLVPIVVDMTVFVFSGVDLVLARLDMSHPLARWTVYGATGGTVWLNYSVGGSVAGRVAHVLMPAIWVVFVELMRHVVRRQANLATGSHREPIPTARWLLSPWPTLKLWRRMVLWRVHSYPRALDQEKMRLGAVAAAREMHGRLWRFRISPLTRLQINLGELGANDLRPVAAVAPGAVTDSGSGVHVINGAAPAASGVSGVAGLAGVTTNGYGAGPGGAGDGAASAAQVNYAAANGSLAHAGTHGEPGAPDGVDGSPDGVLNGAPQPPAEQRAQPAANGSAAHAGAHGEAGAANGSEPLPGVAAAGAAAGAVAREAAAQHAAKNPAVPAQRAHAAPPAVAFPPDGRRPQQADSSAARQDPPHVEFQAPPPMPPLPRRSTRESELLTAAREVERWRGQPSASRISRELGIGMALATSLANALRDEDGLGPDDVR